MQCKHSDCDVESLVQAQGMSDCPSLFKFSYMRIGILILGPTSPTGRISWIDCPGLVTSSLAVQSHVGRLVKGPPQQGLKLVHPSGYWCTSESLAADLTLQHKFLHCACSWRCTQSNKGKPVQSVWGALVWYPVPPAWKHWCGLQSRRNGEHHFSNLSPDFCLPVWWFSSQLHRLRGGWWISL